LNWNLGEENTQSPDEQRDMAKYIVSMDPYPHPVVVHTFPHQQDQGYLPLLGRDSSIHGASLQNSWNSAHQRTLKWLKESAKAGQPWVVCNDEQGPASLGVPPDEGYAGFNGIALDAKETSKEGYTAHDIRKFTLWGTLTAGGGGVEYYFGYALPQNDLVCEDFRSRDRSWDYGRIALAFFREHRIPIIEMTNADELIGNPNNDNTRYCLAKPGHIYVVYLPHGGPSDLDLSRVTGQFQVDWYDPRRGGPLRQGEVTTLTAGGVRSLGRPPAEPSQDWVALIRKTAN
jgi:hypothetical protein